MPTLQKYLGEVYLWKYIPNLPAAITFAILFLLASILHGWAMSRNRSWFCLPFFIGGIFEVIGYIARALAYDSTGSMGLFIIQAIFLLLPPVFFAASLYMVYGRIVRSAGGGSFSMISPVWTTRAFVIADIACLNIQSTGAGLTPKANLAKIGDAIIIAGLGLQVLVFAAFFACCIVFHVRFQSHIRRSKVNIDLPWQSCLGMLYANSFLIQIRNIFRMAEYAMGSDGYLFGNEWPTYAFDGTLMLVVMICFLIWYPSEFDVVSSSSIELAESLTTPTSRPVT